MPSTTIQAWRHDKLLFVLSTLGPAAHALNCMYGAISQIEVVDQFFLVLMELRWYTKKKLNYRGSLTYLTIFLYMDPLRVIAVERGIYMACFLAPDSFRAKFSTTRVIVGGIECPIKKQKLPKAQQSTYSTCKNRNTIKVLVDFVHMCLLHMVVPPVTNKSWNAAQCHMIVIVVIRWWQTRGLTRKIYDVT